MNKAIVVMTTVQKPQDAERLANLLIEKRVAACIQILPPMTSIYRWQEKIERSTECLVLIKTSAGSFPTLEKLIIDHHPYQTPEIIALSVEAGSDDYLAWVASSVDS